jgi:hypothetical protein
VVATELARAIRVLMVDDDPISAHLLTMAARDIIHALAKVEKTPRVWDQLSERIYEDKQHAFYGILKEEYNFFKHADPNRPAVSEHYLRSNTEMMLWETCVDCEYLFGFTFMDTQFYQIWYMSHHPTLFQADYVAKFEVLRNNGPEHYDSEGRMTREAFRNILAVIDDPYRGYELGRPMLASEAARPPTG